MLLAAVWLLAQLTVAFHIGHTDAADGFAAPEHSCPVCKLAQLGDVLLAASVGLFIAAAVLAVLLPVSDHRPAFRICLVRARAPPSA